MPEGEPYEPSPEEIANAEEMMTDEERRASAERAAQESSSPELRKGESANGPTRQERFARNLENLEGLDLKAIYPEELQQRSWDIVEKPEEIEQFYNDFVALKWDRPHPAIYSIYRDRETGQMFATFKNEREAQVVLDLLFAHSRIAPWSPIKALVLQDEEVPIGESKKPARLESHHSVIKATSKVIEDIVNGLGDPRHTTEKKGEFLLTDLGCIVHEAVHSKNEPGISFGSHLGPEADASLAEYLVAPGRNSKMGQFVGRGMELLRGQGEKARTASDYYSTFLIFGILALAEQEGVLPNGDSAEGVAAAIETMNAKICRMDRNELSLYRNKAESIFLSDEDETMEDIIKRLKGKYPGALNFE